MTVAGPLLTEDLDRPYEYRTFKVGDRVRVRLSPECQAEFHPHVAIVPTGEVVRHDPNEEGLIGTIDHRPVAMSLPSHPHFVRFDHMAFLHAGVFWACSYASSELEPLDPEASQ